MTRDRSTSKDTKPKDTKSKDVSSNDIRTELIPFVLFLLATATVGYLSTYVILGGNSWLWLVVLLGVACMGACTIHFAEVTRSETQQNAVPRPAEASSTRKVQLRAVPGGQGRVFRLLMAEGSDLVVPATVDSVVLQPSASDHENLGDKHVDELVEGLLLGYTNGGANLKSGESKEEGLKDLMQALQEMDCFVKEYSGRK